jgi:hypothetical protein
MCLFFCECENAKNKKKKKKIKLKDPLISYGYSYQPGAPSVMDYIDVSIASKNETCLEWFDANENIQKKEIIPDKDFYFTYYKLLRKLLKRF